MAPGRSRPGPTADIATAAAGSGSCLAPIHTVSGLHAHMRYNSAGTGTSPRAEAPANAGTGRPARPAFWSPNPAGSCHKRASRRRYSRSTVSSRSSARPGLAISTKSAGYGTSSRFRRNASLNSLLARFLWHAAPSFLPAAKPSRGILCRERATTRTNRGPSTRRPSRNTRPKAPACRRRLVGRNVALSDPLTERRRSLAVVPFAAVA